MCGIVGYIGNKQVVPILLDGLQKLEYRGYDSAGIAVLLDGKIERRRIEGKIAGLKEKMAKEPINGFMGIGHTRWATHGRPTEENAHPHIDCKNEIVLVHNGIIENYFTLRQELIELGHKFVSDTDTEVLAHLIEENNKSGNFLEAVVKSLKEAEGSYALAIVLDKTPDKLYAARLGSPLVIGIGEGEYYIASDVLAILNYTKKVIFLEDGEIAEVSKEGFHIYTIADLSRVNKKAQLITWDPITAEKSGYRHFMLKEIYEQPRVIEENIKGRLSKDKEEVYLDFPDLPDKELEGIKKVLIIACGTSYHAGLVGKFILEKILRISVEVDIGSEFRYRDPIIDKNTLLIAISQSGETADTIAAVKEAQKSNAKIISICNVLDSSITRLSHGVIYTHAGPEVGVASTKAFTAQLTALYLLALYLGKLRKSISKIELIELIDELLKLPKKVEAILENDKDIIKCSKTYFKYKNFLYLGRGINYPIALEGALKLKEISYLHAEGYPAGEMKHGPIALIDENMPIVAIVPHGQVYDKMVSNLREVQARQGVIVAVGYKNDEIVKEMSDYFFTIPETIDFLTPILTIIPLQLLAYHVALKLGVDIDQPRNLAKSVTVE
ncbi:MAG: glutamine--fructose-6-phosphate transaminase (isomerizing) [bacterium]|nr:glutamine--fructose-6-phosphate transaminase (isomerizing) [bacterium]